MPTHYCERVNYLISLSVVLVFVSTVFATYSTNLFIGAMPLRSRFFQFGSAIVTFSSVVIATPIILVFGAAHLGAGYGYGGLTLITAAIFPCVLIAVVNAILMGLNLKRGNSLGHGKSKLFGVLLFGITITSVWAYVLSQ